MHLPGDVRTNHVGTFTHWGTDKGELRATSILPT
jgi:hypothetical protein